jgi:hypothetical protein
MADDVASLGFDVDSTPLVAAAAAGDKLSATMRNLGQAHGVAGVQAQAVTKATDQANAAAARHAAAAALEAREIAGLSRASGVLIGQLEASAASLGRLGGYLSSFGLAGVAVGASLAAVVITVRSLMEAANRMGELSRQLRDSAQTIGINTDQLQALNIAAAASGVSAEANTMAFARFTVQLDQLRSHGTGPLFTELNEKVGPELVRQLAATKDSTSAIDLLASAYARATDQAQKNAIARAAFGRQGFAEGRILTAIDTAGGLNAYKAGLNATDMLTQDQIKHWALLSIEIEHATTLAKNNFASIFTGPVLEAEAQWAHVFLDISREAKSFTASPDLLTFLKWTSPAYQAARLSGLVSVPKIEITAPAVAGTFGAGLASAAKAPRVTGPAFDAEVMKIWVGAMGSAVTVSEQLELKLKELAKAYSLSQLGTIGETEALQRRARASSMINLESEIQMESFRHGLLGQAASAQDSAGKKTKPSPEKMPATDSHGDRDDRDQYHLPAAA